MRRAAIAPPALLLLALLGAPAARGSAPVLVPSERLSVNTDDRFSRVVHAPLKDGLAALEDLVFTSDREEAWMYDPRTSDWIEIGQGADGWRAPGFTDLQEGIIRARNSARIDPALFAQLRPRANAEIHIHPVLGDPGYRLARMQEDYGACAAYLDAIKITRAVPSVDDLKESLREVVVFGVAVEPFSIYFGSLGGVTRFSFTTAGRAHARTLLAGMTRAQLLGGMELPLPAQAYAAEIRDRIVQAVNTDAATRGAQTYDAFLNEVFSRSSDERFRIRYATYRDLDALWTEGW